MTGVLLSRCAYDYKIETGKEDDGTIGAWEEATEGDHGG